MIRGYTSIKHATHYIHQQDFGPLSSMYNISSDPAISNDVNFGINFVLKCYFRSLSETT